MSFPRAYLLRGIVPDFVCERTQSLTLANTTLLLLLLALWCVEYLWYCYVRQVTPEERAICIQLALRFAEPERIAAVHRGVHHSEAARDRREVACTSTEEREDLHAPAHLPNSRLRVYRSGVSKHVAKRSSGLARAPLGTINESLHLE